MNACSILASCKPVNNPCKLIDLLVLEKKQETLLTNYEHGLMFLLLDPARS